MSELCIIHIFKDPGQQIRAGCFCNVEKLKRIQRKAKEGERERDHLKKHCE